MYLADAFIQSAFRSYIYYQYVGIEPTTFALLMQCSTTEPQEHQMVKILELEPPKLVWSNWSV